MQEGEGGRGSRRRGERRGEGKGEISDKGIVFYRYERSKLFPEVGAGEGEKGTGKAEVDAEEGGGGEERPDGTLYKAAFCPLFVATLSSLPYPTLAIPPPVLSALPYPTLVPSPPPSGPGCQGQPLPVRPTLSGVRIRGRI